MLKIGLFGIGHLGKIHSRCIAQIEELNLIGFYDPDDTNAEAFEKEFQIPRYTDQEALINDCDLLDIVTPTITHFAIADKCLDLGKHVFIEKPITQSVEDALALVEKAKSKGLKIQVGHVERFNPAFKSISNLKLRPAFIEAHRLANFNPRGTDVSVVLDLMIHDIDLVLNMVGSEVVDVQATGVSLISKTSDISNVRLTFANGAVANLTASRLSIKQMRKLRLFQPDAYISLDFLDKNAQIVRLYDEEPVDAEGQVMQLDTQMGNRYLEILMPETEKNNAIMEELISFKEAIVNDTTPIVSGEDGYKALKLAHQIIATIDQHQATIKDLL